MGSQGGLDVRLGAKSRYERLEVGKQTQDGAHPRVGAYPEGRGCDAGVSVALAGRVGWVLRIDWLVSLWCVGGERSREVESQADYLGKRIPEGIRIKVNIRLRRD